MFQRNSSLTASPGKASSFSQSLSLLSTVGGIAAAILLTPLLFGLTEPVLSPYFAKHWGPDLASMLTFVFGGIEFLVIGLVTKLLISLGTTSVVVALAARRVFPHY